MFVLMQLLGGALGAAAVRLLYARPSELAGELVADLPHAALEPS